VVNAGPDQEITLPATATLSGSATDDGLPNPPSALTVSWIAVTGPGTVNFDNPAGLATSAAFSAAGTYTLVLTASDGLLSSSDEISITVHAAPPINQPPLVNAGLDETITLPATASLSGTATDDGLPNPPAALTTTWSLVSGPGTVTFANAAALATTATFSVAGSYTVRLTASDGSLTASDDVVVTVNEAIPVNQPPVVNAGSDQTITLPATAALSGTATDDGLPNPPAALSTTWSLVSGPGTVIFANAAALATTATFSAAGSYTVRLTASDSELSSTDDIVVTVNEAIPVNQPPVVNAGADQVITLPATAALSGTATDDGLPNPPAALSTTWSLVSGPGTVTFANAAALATTATFSVAGSYTLALTASDGALSTTDDIAITVSAVPNQPPVVNAGADQAITLPATASLSGSATDDALPNPPGALTITWSVVSGPGTVTFADAAALATTATFSVAGSYTLRLTASDGELSASDDVVVTVSQAVPINQPPVVNAGPDQAITLPGTANLSGTATDDNLPNPPGALTTTWSVVSGPGTVTFANAAALATTATFSVAGSYTLRLTASDSELSASDDIVVAVSPVPNQAPVVNAGPDQTITLPAAASLSGSATDDGLPIPPGALTTVWSKVSGPGTVTFANAAALATTATFSVAGSYTLRLTASDSVLSTSDEIVVTVNPVPNRPPVVNAGPDQAITLPAAASLSGAATDDGLPMPPGALTITWSKVSGPGTVTFANPAALATTATFSVAGSYTLRLTASDSVLSASDDIIVTVNPAPNRAPVVNAGPDQAVTLPTAASLSGTATDDGLPNPPGALTITWSKVSGPGTVTFANAAALATTATFSVAGSYTLRLTASDSVLSASDDIVVTANPGTPCSGLCTNPINFTINGTYQSGNLGTGAVCYQTMSNMAGGNCGNFVSPRTLKVNGTTEACNGGNWSSIPAKRNGGYCIQTTSGNQPWAYFTSW
jgi:PKD repeat protein